MVRPTEIRQHFPNKLGIAIGVSHWIAFMMLFGYSWGFGVTQNVPPIWLEPLMWLLGSPLMSLLLLLFQLVTGNGGGGVSYNGFFLFCITVLNSTLWGAGIGWIVQFFRRRMRV